MRSFVRVRQYLWNDWLTWLPGSRLRCALLRALLGAQIGDRTVLWRGVKVDGNSYYRIRIGRDCVIPRGALFNATAGVTIGDGVFLGHDVSFHCADHDVDSPTMPARYAPIAVGHGAWIASKASILKGVTVGEGAVIAYGAVVTRDVPPLAIVAGVPARIVRYRRVEASGALADEREAA
jgi:acetyltransferase-like isoleucine patch superfamily enzyme